MRLRVIVVLRRPRLAAWYSGYGKVLYGQQVLRSSYTEGCDVMLRRGPLGRLVSALRRLVTC